MNFPFRHSPAAAAPSSVRRGPPVLQRLGCAALLTAAGLLASCASQGSSDEDYSEDETTMNANPRRPGLPPWSDSSVARGIAVVPFNGMVLHKDAARRLVPVLDRLNERPAEHVIMIGSARDQDSAEYGRQLAEARACVVKEWFSDKGIVEDRLHTGTLAPDRAADSDSVEVGIFTPATRG